MAKPGKASNSRWLDYCVWSVALWASFLNLLNFNDYPLFRPEVALTLLSLGLIGLVMGLVQHVARPRLSFLFVALFAGVMVDLNTTISLNWFYALWAGLAIVAFFLQDGLLKIAFAAAATVFIFQFAALVTKTGEALNENQAQNLQANGRSSARPAIVHLVLDSYLGLDGMALGPDVYRNLRAGQIGFFTEHGFQVYPRAYSRHTKTLNSLPHLFSYGGPEPAIHSINPQYSVPEQLPYFADLDSRGYRISAMLPAHFDLCVHQKLTRCSTFESSTLTSMLGTEMSALDRAKVFGFTMLNLTGTANRLVSKLRLDPKARMAHNRSELFPLSSIEKLDRFTANLADLRRGEVRFAHLLLPHDPYMLSSDCTVKPEAAWLDEHGPGTEAAREKGYADQVQCLQRRLGHMLDALDRTSAGREAIVLIHGDHGSRIAPAQPFIDGPELSSRELLMSYSTFFAIRVPGEAGGEVPGTYALGELMANFRARDFASAPRPPEASRKVAVLDAFGTAREWRPLPDFAP